MSKVISLKDAISKKEGIKKLKEIIEKEGGV